jgi:hypothetical protein
MDGRTGQYALFGERLRLFSTASLAERAASRYIGSGAIQPEEPGPFNFWFGTLLGADGNPRGRDIL